MFDAPPRRALYCKQPAAWQIRRGETMLWPLSAMHSKVERWARPPASPILLSLAPSPSRQVIGPLVFGER